MCGGEPLFKNDIIPFIKKIKLLGYAVKIDTNGSTPEILEEIVVNKLADFIAMDLKTKLTEDKYSVATAMSGQVSKVKRSMGILKKPTAEQFFWMRWANSLLPCR